MQIKIYSLHKLLVYLHALCNVNRVYLGPVALWLTLGFVDRSLGLREPGT